MENLTLENEITSSIYFCIEKLALEKVTSQLFKMNTPFREASQKLFNHSGPLTKDVIILKF